MIDLNKTWCEATEENYETLVKLGVKLYKFELLRNGDVLFIENNYIAVNTKEYIEDDRQIHLVNGEFEYVADTNVGEIESFKEEHEEANEILSDETCCFKKYGFEVPQHNNVLKVEITDKIDLRLCTCLDENIDFSYVGYVLCEDGVIPVEWNINGYCVTDSSFNLTPLKKPWYEDRNNYGQMIIREGNNSVKTIGIFMKYEDGIIYGIDKYGEFTCAYNIARPATKEEVLQLVIN